MITDIQWELVKRMALTTAYHALYRDNELGVQMETVTRRTNYGYGIGKSDTSFFIDNDEREFKTQDELIDAYNEKFRYEGENPHEEVTYIKVIKKRENDSL